MIRRGLKGRLPQGQEHQGGKTTIARARIGHHFPRCKTRTILSILLFVTATVRLYSNSYSNSYNDDANHIHQVQAQQLPEWYLDNGDDTTTDTSCAESLVAGKKAVIADSSMTDPSTSFRILLHPRTKDTIITRRIQTRGVYEPEMEDFIVRALPKNAENSGANGGANSNSDSGRTAATKRQHPWALDLGANVGFHSLHMAQRGANVISFEPAPDTAELFQCSAKLLLLDAANRKTETTTTTPTKHRGSIRVVQAGASNVESSQAKLSRHPDSPGLTTFGSSNVTTNWVMHELENTTGKIKLLRPQDVLEDLQVPEGRSEVLRLLKVDVEGYELKALQGLNLTRFPFEFLTFEFFPELLRASGTDPLDLLEYVRETGYQCDQDSGQTRDERNAWVHGIQGHVNFFCQLSD